MYSPAGTTTGFEIAARLYLRQQLDRVGASPSDSPTRTAAMSPTPLMVSVPWPSVV
jgi:glucan biosynthesis protein